MNYRRLGRSGLMVSELSLGTMNFGGPTDENTAIRMIDTALDHGINLLDCANVYSDGRSESIIGKALKKSSNRRNVLVTTKAFLPTGNDPNERGNTRHNLINSCLTSLHRLDTDYIDIFFLHRTDWNVPQEETLSALNYLVNRGYVRYCACSTHPAWRTVESLHIADHKGFPSFVCEQPPYNLLDRRIENEIVPMCQSYDLGIITWSPLAQGVLADRYQSAVSIPSDSRGARKKAFAERITDRGIEIARKVAAIAQEKHLSPSALSVSWVLHHPFVSSVIIGPRTPEHLDDLMSSPTISLTGKDMAWFDTLVAPGTFVSNHFNTAGWHRPYLGR